MSETYRCGECGRVYDNGDVCPECGCLASYTWDEDFPTDEVDLDLEELDLEEDEEEAFIEELEERPEERLEDEEFDDELMEYLTAEDILGEEDTNGSV